MNANGVLASVNFPTAAGFAGAWPASNRIANVGGRGLGLQRLADR